MYDDGSVSPAVGVLCDPGVDTCSKELNRRIHGAARTTKQEL